MTCGSTPTRSTSSTRSQSVSGPTRPRHPGCRSRFPRDGACTDVYAMKLPPELVRRLYVLRETHRLGPIRRQVLIAVEHYLEEMEKEYGTGYDRVGGVAPTVRQRR